jgi:hypothetical protein
MKTTSRNILILFLFAVLASVLVYLYTFRKSDVSVGSKKADVEIEAPALLEAFETDEDSANELYLGKIISVTGTVESVSEDSVGISVYLKEMDAIAGVICSFDKESNDISTVEKGNKVIIKGICTGYLMDVVLNRCALESEGPLDEARMPGSN